MEHLTSRVWSVAALCRAIADALETRFNPITVCGEISGFSRAASGHCYFNLKDEGGQIRCAMFRRAASLMDFSPRDGDKVELRGRLGVYEPRGDLQLIVESMSRAGQGVWFEEFLKLKARLQAEGLFDAERKRDLPLMPRAIGVVTSLGAAALHDVVTALQRRAPHIPVVVSPASVQGASAPAELCSALQALYRYTTEFRPSAYGQPAKVDVILLVRGGGSMEDLWAFNDEGLARTIIQSPVPVVCGVGHETDFTIADFVADLRAPTPTAAAELVAQSRQVWLDTLDLLRQRLDNALERVLDQKSQRLDQAALRLGRPSSLLARHALVLSSHRQRLQFACTQALAQRQREVKQLSDRVPQQVGAVLASQRQRLERIELRLERLNPQWVLQRGYAWLSDEQGVTITQVGQTHTGQTLQATLSDGKVDLSVLRAAEN